MCIRDRALIRKPRPRYGGSEWVRLRRHVTFVERHFACIQSLRNYLIIIIISSAVTGGEYGVKDHRVADWPVVQTGAMTEAR